MLTAQPVFAAWSWQTPEEDPVPALLELLRLARKSILVCAYGFTLATVVDELIAAHKRGVEVRLILDESQAAGKAEHVQIGRLLKAKVPLRTGRSERGGIIHLKRFIVDGRWLWTGSFNISSSADKQDNEVLLFHWPVEEVNAVRVRKFRKEWKRLSKS